MLNSKDVRIVIKVGSEAISRGELSFREGKFYGIIGQWAGKSTLLSLWRVLIIPERGRSCLTEKISEKKAPVITVDTMFALVFQNYNLDYLTPLENVRLVNKNADKKILSELGLDEKQINQCPHNFQVGNNNDGPAVRGLWFQRLRLS